MSRGLCVLAVLALLAGGCASRRAVDRLESEVGRLRSELAEMRVAQETTSRGVGNLTSQLQSLDVPALGEEVARLNRRADATEMGLAATRTQLDTLAPPTGASSPAVPTPAGTSRVPSPAPPSTVMTSPVPAPLPPNTAGAAPAPTPPPSATTVTPTKAAAKSAGNPEQEYAAALATYRAREHGQAVIDFLDFIAKYPTHPLAGNAQYWIGEAYWAQRDYRQALVEFEKVFDHGPGKAPDAQLKIGLCYLRLGDVQRAQQAWQRVVNEYPKSESAAMAKSLLATHSAARR
jgi:tol-pal system protein YbgF